MRHGDPLMVYRWPREAVVAAFAFEEAATLDRNEEIARLELEAAKKGRRTTPGASKGLLSHPQVQCASPEAAKFWGLL